MMKHQRTSIRKQKCKNYTVNIICSVPSDKDVIYPIKTSNINDYNISDLTPQQIEIAKKLMEIGYKGGVFNLMFPISSQKALESHLYKGFR